MTMGCAYISLCGHVKQNSALDEMSLTKERKWFFQTFYIQVDKLSFDKHVASAVFGKLPQLKPGQSSHSRCVCHVLFLGDEQILVYQCVRTKTHMAFSPHVYLPWGMIGVWPWQMQPPVINCLWLFLFKRIVDTSVILYVLHSNKEI